jgi:hypothetical protein
VNTATGLAADAPAGDITVNALEAATAVTAKAIEEGEKRATAADQESAEAAPLTGFTGGSIGFPTDGASGVVAAAKLQTGGAAFDTSILARASSLDIGTVGGWRASIDVFAETIQVQLPGVEYALGSRPLPVLASTDLVSLGFRIKLSPALRTPQNPAALKQRISSCISHKMNNAAAPAGCDYAKYESAFDEAGNLDAKKLEELVATETQEIEAAHLYGWSFAPGVRFLYRDADQTGNAAAGIAGEMNVQYAWTAGAFFVSASGLSMNEAVKFDENDPDALASVQEALLEAKGTVGVYWQGRRDAGLLAPRAGLYYSYSRNWWDNRFAPTGMDANVSGHQQEAAAFFSGTFSSGVSGLFTFGVRRPYGPENELQYIFGFSPAFGDQVGASKESP